MTICKHGVDFAEYRSCSECNPDTNDNQEQFNEAAINYLKKRIKVLYLTIDTINSNNFVRSTRYERDEIDEIAKILLILGIKDEYEI